MLLMDRGPIKNKDGTTNYGSLWIVSEDGEASFAGNCVCYSLENWLVNENPNIVVVYEWPSGIVSNHNFDS